MPVGKHSIELSTDQPSPKELANDSQRGLVLHFISQQSSPMPIGDTTMSVIPEGKRPRLLPISEHEGWVILGMQRDPADWDDPEDFTLEYDPAADLK